MPNYPLVNNKTLKNEFCTCVMVGAANNYGLNSLAELCPPVWIASVMLYIGTLLGSLCYVNHLICKISFVYFAIGRNLRIFLFSL